MTENSPLTPHLFFLYTILMRFGYHVSISGGLKTALAEAKELTCNTIQIFLGPPQMWKLSSFTDEEIAQFDEERRKLDITPVIAHSAYLLNVSSPNDHLWNISVHYLINLLEKAEKVGVEGITFHLGSNPGRRAGVQKAIEAMRKIEDEAPAGQAKILLETDAGPGNHVGDNFEEISEILGSVKNPQRFGVVLDTCHIFASGYDLRTAEAANKTFAKFEKLIGYQFLAAIHINDSKGELGSHLDRHEHIGEGKIGADGFKAILHHPKLQEMAFILETPKTGNLKTDLKDIQTLRKLAK